MERLLMRQYQQRPSRLTRTQQSPMRESQTGHAASAKTPPVQKISGAPAQPSREVQRTGLPGYSLASIPIFPPDASSSEIHAAAQQGQRTPASRLPYSARLQTAFGHHDLSDVQAHVSPQAQVTAQAIRAAAFASGNHVVFANQPNLRTVAHEAAHIVQQRAGVQLPGGIGSDGDRYEHHADAVASRVVAGQSAEQLLDHFISGQQQTHLLPIPAVQRIREGLTEETKPLESAEEKKQKEVFSLPKGAAKRKKQEGELVKLQAKDVDTKLLQRLSDQLIKIANKVNKDIEKKAPDYVKSGSGDLKGTPYYTILELAINKVLGQYGTILEKALQESQGKGPGPLAMHTTAPLGLKSSLQAYADLKEEDKQAEAKAAIYYQIEHNGAVQKVMKEIVYAHSKNLTSGKELDPKSVEAVYAQALLDQQDEEKKELIEALSKQKSLHAPQTRDSTIYLEPHANEGKARAWLHYRQLIHEALHTAAHSKFEEYLNTLPGELRDIINEGTIDYFANKIWKAVVAQLEAKKSNPDVAKVHGVIENPDPKKYEADILNEVDLEILQESSVKPLYPNEVKKIDEALKTFKSGGEDRLKAAFFYGDVNHFFPAFEEAMETEVPLSREERKKEVETTEKKPSPRQRLKKSKTNEEPEESKKETGEHA